MQIMPIVSLQPIRQRGYPPKITYHTTAPPQVRHQSPRFQGLMELLFAPMSAYEKKGYVPIPLKSRAALQQNMEQIMGPDVTWADLARGERSIQQTVKMESVLTQIIYQPCIDEQGHHRLILESPSPGGETSYEVELLISAKGFPVYLKCDAKAQKFLVRFYKNTGNGQLSECLKMPPKGSGAQGLLFAPKRGLLRPLNLTAYRTTLKKMIIRSAMLDTPQDVPEAFVSQVVDRLARYPIEVIDALHTHNYRLVCSPLLVRTFPELEAEPIYGAKSGATWNQAIGMHQGTPGDRVIAVAFQYESLGTGGLETNDEVNRTLDHEVGHVMDTVNQDPSQGKAFLLAYQQDLYELTPEQRTELANALDVEESELEGHRALTELFAEIHQRLKLAEYWLDGPPRRGQRVISKPYSHLIRVTHQVASYTPRFPKKYLPPIPPPKPGFVARPRVSEGLRPQF